MTAILLDALVPIFAVMGLGYFAGWKRDIDNHHVAELNALVMDFALPASLFVATASTSRALILRQWPLLLLLCVSMVVLYAGSYWIQRRLFALDSREAAVQSLTIALPNFAAAGLPLIGAVFGPRDTIEVALAIGAGSIVLVPPTLAILEVQKAPGGEGARLKTVLEAVRRSLLRPIVLGPLLGISYSLLAFPLPDAANRSLQLIGQAAGGVALFVTGLVLSAQRLEFSPSVWSGTFVKNLVHPLVAALLVLMLPLDRDTARAALLLCALPSGFFGVLFALRYGFESRVAGSTLIVSALASAVTLPILLVLTAAW